MAPRRTQIYVHIGPPKTATTYIQDILWGNEPALAAQGVSLPGGGVNQHFYAAMDLRDMRLGEYDDPRVPGTWESLAAKAKQSKTGKVLISHELFAGAEKAQIERLAGDLEGAEVHIIYTARDLGRQLPAVWQESLKNLSSRPFDRFLKRSFVTKRAQRRPHFFWTAHDSVAVLGNWSAAAPPERIHILTAPPSGGPANELWSRFATALGVDPDAFDLSVARPNSSLTRVDAEVLRRINAALPKDLSWPDYQRLVKRRFNHLANEQVRGDRTRIPERFKEAVQLEADRIRKHIAESGYDVIGDLDDLVVGDAAFSRTARVPEREVADAATKLLATVLLRPTLKGKGAAEEAHTPGQRRDKLREGFYSARNKVRGSLRR